MQRQQRWIRLDTDNFVQPDVKNAFTSTLQLTIDAALRRLRFPQNMVQILRMADRELAVKSSTGSASIFLACGVPQRLSVGPVIYYTTAFYAYACPAVSASQIDFTALVATVHSTGIRGGQCFAAASERVDYEQCWCLVKYLKR